MDSQEVVGSCYDWQANNLKVECLAEELKEEWNF
jgi:hypothetical protein